MAEGKHLPTMGVDLGGTKVGASLVDADPKAGRRLTSLADSS